MTSADAGTPPPLPRLIGRTVDRLVAAFSPERIVLFGSYAKGTTNGGSDVDLLVIARVTGDRAASERRARQLAADCFPPVDVVLATPEEVTEAPTAASPFLWSILGAGVTLYARR
jgi:predicted nucleotidyltransferase